MRFPMRLQRRSQNVPIEGLPTEFRIFVAGVNESTKGSVVFDEGGAASVMAAYTKHGADIMIDYDHASLSPFAMDPALAARAAGWCGLEIRNGELWAVGVKWTPSAAIALSNKEWRYMSPAFMTDEKSRVVELVNIALTNIPATHGLTPLVAANRKTLQKRGVNGMLTSEQIAAIIALLDGGDLEGAKAALQVIAAGAPPAEEAPTEPPSEEMQAASETPPTADEEKDKELMAAGRMALSITGAETPASAIAMLSVMAEKLRSIAEREAQVAADRAALEASERKELVVQLVKLGAEVPATAWSDSTASTPCARLQAEPLAELRARVKVLSGAKGGKTVTAPATEPSQGGKIVKTRKGDVELTAREVKICQEVGTDLVAYATSKAERNSK